MFVAVSAFAQDRTITGLVSSAEDGSPIPGASVRLKGDAKVAVATDGNGRYTIKVPASGTTLIFSSIGFTSKEQTITGSTVNVTLAVDAQTLSEVAIVGYGTGKALGQSVASVRKVNSEVVENRPTANAFDALQGQVGGLTVFTSSGEPSATSSLRIQGVGSLGASSTPLYLVDGIPSDGSVVVNINPNDIESVDVLKDAAATSIYGSRAANGVIVINTKRGSANRAASITFTSQMSDNSLTENTLDVFKSVMSADELFKYWVQTGYRTQAQADAMKAQYPNDYQWYKAYYKDNAQTYQNDLNIAGGAGKTNYYISFGQINQDGMAFRSMLKRYTLLSNINTKVNDWFEIGLKLQFGHTEWEENGWGSNSTNRGLFLLRQPMYSLYDSNGQIYPDLIPGGNFYNPHYLADKNPDVYKRYQYNPMAYIQLTPLKGLTWKTQAGLDGYFRLNEWGVLPSYLGAAGVGSWNQQDIHSTNMTIFNTLEYKFTLPNMENHKFTILGGHEYSDNTYKTVLGGAGGLTDDRLMLIQNGTAATRTVSQSKSEYAFNSYFARLEYGLNDKYFFEGLIRQDESSRFGANNKKANFWSAGLMWNAKRESFLANVDAVSQFTVRLSTGTSGNAAIGDYAHLATVGTTNSYTNPGWAIGSAGNPDLTWEKQQKTTLGLNMELFNRLRMQIDLYDRQTTSMLTSVPYPYTSGFSSISSNVGKLQNRGVDLDLSYELYRNQDRSAFFTPYVNFGYNRDKILELFQGRDYWVIANTGVSWVVGSRVNFLYPIWKGVDPANGNPLWYVPNSGDGFIETRKDDSAVSSTFNAADLQQNTGINRYAPFNGGFGFNSGYKGLRLTANFTFSHGKYLINNDAYFFENPNQFTGYNQSRVVTDYWKAPGDQTRFPRYGVQFTQFDSRLIQNASFMRLKYLELSYSLPKNWLASTKIFKSASISLSGRNLLTFTKYPGPDPEVDSNLSLGANPNTKQYTFGLRVGL